MDSKGIKLSKITKDRIDEIIHHLDHYAPKDARPFVVKICLMHGIENFNNQSSLPDELKSGAWDMGAIINGNDYLLGKHLIINDMQKEIIEEKDIRDAMRKYIELGTMSIYSLIESSSDLFEEDFLIKLLTA